MLLLVVLRKFKMTTPARQTRRSAREPHKALSQKSLLEFYKVRAIFGPTELLAADPRYRIEKAPR